MVKKRTPFLSQYSNTPTLQYPGTSVLSCVSDERSAEWGMRNRKLYFCELN